jgi:WD40 repeat protein
MSLSELNPVDSQKIISGSEDGTINIWDGKKGMILNGWEEYSQAVTYRGSFRLPTMISFTKANANSTLGKAYCSLD